MVRTRVWAAAGLMALCARLGVAAQEPQLRARDLFPDGRALAPLGSSGFKPIGLKIQILKAQASGGFAAVDPKGTEFQNGDRVRIAVQPNQEVFGLVLHRGSSGRWAALSQGWPQKLTAYGTYTIPPDHERALQFDNRAGGELICLVMSRVDVDRPQLLAILNNIDGETSLTAADETSSASVAAAIGRPRDILFEAERPASAAAGTGVVLYAAEPPKAAGASLVVNIILRHIGKD